LSLYCYESGQGLVGNSTYTDKLQMSIQHDLRMTSLYEQYFEVLFNNSIKLSNQYSDIGI
jgi:hypothetical protein